MDREVAQMMLDTIPFEKLIDTSIVIYHMYVHERKETVKQRFMYTEEQEKAMDQD